jgi:hypothetical protein
MRKPAVVPLTGAAVAQGVELAVQASATAAEALRARRDPALAAAKKRRAAKRRVAAWSVGAVLSGAVTATGAASMIEGDTSSGAIGGMILLVAVLTWCIVGIIRASIDLRARSRMIATLPAPAPSRPAVAIEIRPEMVRLNGYSDGLRHLVGMIGIVDDDAGVRALRDEILSAADASEARLRRQAIDLTVLLKARRNAPPEAAKQLEPTVGRLRQQIHDGVVGYGDLVSAASEAVAATRNLADQTGRSGSGVPVIGGSAASSGTLHPELDQPIEQLRALAAGMRDLTQD